MRKQYNFWPWPTADGITDAWDVDRLIRLAADLPIEHVRLDSISQLDTPHWGVVTPRDLAQHVQLVHTADLAFPIVLSPDGRVMDGMHRVVKALLERRDTIAAVRFEVLPDPDFRDCRPEDLPYE